MAATGLEPEYREDGESIAWHVLRSRPKAEHLAAAHVERLPGVEEAYCPRIACRKPTRRGPVRFVEALFPGYLFARFDRETSLRAVRATPQVTDVIRFGEKFATLSESDLKRLRSEFPGPGPREMAPDFPLAAGDEAEILTGALSGFSVLVERVLPGAERVRILLDWLGDRHEAEVPASTIRRRGGRS